VRLRREPSDAEKGAKLEKRGNAGISIARTFFVNFCDVQEKPRGWELISDCSGRRQNLKAGGWRKYLG
jgi:hypothetical protein